MNKIDTACLIDDDPIFIYGAKRIMELSNFCNSFMVFKNGQEALNALTPIIISGENIPDVILLDINMPIMDGWQFLDEFIKIKTENKVTIFVVSSSIDPMDINKVKDYENVINYINKPISITTLKNIFEEMTEQ